MPEGGVLTISSCFNAKEKLVEIEVKDTGRGISPQDLSHIFEPFYTTKEEGEGLGLSTVYGIIEKHRGTISVNSTPMRGTCIKVRLPVQPSRILP